MNAYPLSAKKLFDYKWCKSNLIYIHYPTPYFIARIYLNVNIAENSIHGIPHLLEHVLIDGYRDALNANSVDCGASTDTHGITFTFRFDKLEQYSFIQHFFMQRITSEQIASSIPLVFSEIDIRTHNEYSNFLLGDKTELLAVTASDLNNCLQAATYNMKFFLYGNQDTSDLASCVRDKIYEPKICTVKQTSSDLKAIISKIICEVQPKNSELYNHELTLRRIHYCLLNFTFLDKYMQELYDLHLSCENVNSCLNNYTEE